MNAAQRGLRCEVQSVPCTPRFATASRVVFSMKCGMVQDMSFLSPAKVFKHMSDEQCPACAKSAGPSRPTQLLSLKPRFCLTACRLLPCWHPPLCSESAGLKHRPGLMAMRAAFLDAPRVLELDVSSNLRRRCRSLELSEPGSSEDHSYIATIILHASEARGH